MSAAIIPPYQFSEIPPLEVLILRSDSYRWARFISHFTDTLVTLNTPRLPSPSCHFRNLRDLVFIPPIDELYFQLDSVESVLDGLRRRGKVCALSLSAYIPSWTLPYVIQAVSRISTLITRLSCTTNRRHWESRSQRSSTPIRITMDAFGTILPEFSVLEELQWEDTGTQCARLMPAMPSGLRFLCLRMVNSHIVLLHRRLSVTLEHCRVILSWPAAHLAHIRLRSNLKPSLGNSLVSSRRIEVADHRQVTWLSLEDEVRW